MANTDDSAGSEDAESVARRLARQELEAKAAKITPADVQRVLDAQKELEDRWDASSGRFRKMVKQLKLLFELIKAYTSGEYRQVPYLGIGMAAAALLYFLNPLDLVPDALPLIGQLDDMLVVALSIKAIQEELRKFCAFKGYDPDQYF